MSEEGERTLEVVLTEYGETIERLALDLRTFRTVELAEHIDTPVIGPFCVVELERRRLERIN